MQNSFITNKDKLLSDIINGILPKSQSLDVLVGYFYFSGYKLISEKLIDKHVRILVGLDIDTRITKYIREIDTLADYNKSRSQLKDDYYNHFVRLFNETDFLDSQPKLESFKLFYDKIKAGTLEIRKTDEPCHAKMYIFDYREDINEGGEDPGSEGKKEFLIDAACFPGSSGSPVLICDVGGYRDKQGNLNLGSSRELLLRILYAGPQLTVTGDIKVVTIPNMQQKVLAVSHIPNNLGYIIKSERIMDFLPIIKQKYHLQN